MCFTIALKTACQNRENLLVWLPDHKRPSNIREIIPWSAQGGNVALQKNCRVNNLYVYLIIARGYFVNLYFAF